MNKTAKTLKFTKMHGLGNDFMVIDGINQMFEPENAPLAKWANRYTGVGFDQLLLVQKAQSDNTDFYYRIFNADGSEAAQCGNGARCFMRFVADKKLTDKQAITVDTISGIISMKLSENGMVTVNMGQPRFTPSEIPFVPITEKADALTHTILAGSESIVLSCVNMGNPHAVIVVDNIETASVAYWGKIIESHRQFPERVNVGFMEIVNRTHICLRVYERGVGETQACGSGACAAVVAGVRLGLLEADRQVCVSLPGGDLYVCWQQSANVMIKGPAETVFEGEMQYG